MLKKGFTLQELLISLAVIGVVSALALPAIMNMQPDKNKSMYMKAYNTLAVQTAEILDDSSLYWNTGYNNIGEAESVGLYSDEQPLVAPYNSDINCKCGNKFPAILSHRLNLNGVVTYNSSNCNNPSQVANATFSTTDGIRWSFDTQEVNVDTPGGLGYQTDVTINVNPTDETHACTYSETCTKPNEFTFTIDNEGGITPTDAMGIAYLQNPTDMHATSIDSAAAEKIYKNNKPILDKIDGIINLKPGTPMTPPNIGTSTGSKINGAANGSNFRDTLKTFK